MSAQTNDNEADVADAIIMRVVLDAKTAAWLGAIADGCHAAPEIIAGSLLRDMREDDEIAHDQERAQIGIPALN